VEFCHPVFIPSQEEQQRLRWEGRQKLNSAIFPVRERKAKAQETEPF